MVYFVNGTPIDEKTIAFYDGSNNNITLHQTKTGRVFATAYNGDFFAPTYVIVAPEEDPVFFLSTDAKINALKSNDVYIIEVLSGTIVYKYDAEAQGLTLISACGDVNALTAEDIDFDINVAENKFHVNLSNMELTYDAAAGRYIFNPDQWFTKTAINV